MLVRMFQAVIDLQPAAVVFLGGTNASRVVSVVRPGSCSPVRTYPIAHKPAIPRNVTARRVARHRVSNSLRPAETQSGTSGCPRGSAMGPPLSVVPAPLRSAAQFRELRQTCRRGRRRLVSCSSAIYCRPNNLDALELFGVRRQNAIPTLSTKRPRLWRPMRTGQAGMTF